MRSAIRHPTTREQLIAVIRRNGVHLHLTHISSRQTTWAIVVSRTLKCRSHECLHIPAAAPKGMDY